MIRINKYSKKLAALIICFSLFAVSIIAQPTYNNAVGVKAGFSSGLLFKHFVQRNNAIDVQALYNQFGFQISSLYDYQFSPYGKERLQYYAGIGPYAGNWSGDFSIGAAALLGSEFIFHNAPVILGLEWKPMLNIYKQFYFAFPDFAMTIKIVLN